jgi:hypothetical protein
VCRTILDAARLTRRTDQLSRIECFIRLLTRVTTSEVGLRARVTHVEEILLHGESDWIIVIRAIRIDNCGILIATFILQPLERLLTDSGFECIDRCEDLRECRMLNLLLAQRTALEFKSDARTWPLGFQLLLEALIVENVRAWSFQLEARCIFEALDIADAAIFIFINLQFMLQTWQTIRFILDAVTGTTACEGLLAADETLILTFLLTTHVAYAVAEFRRLIRW